MYLGGPVIAEAVRSGFVESRHHGSVAVLDATGALVAWAGDVHGPVFPRSANKPLQAVGMLQAGLRLADAADLAVVSASHSGEPFHIQRVRDMLGRAGLGEDDLRCPPDLPISEPARAAVLRAGGGPARVQMNCSGKHAGMLLTCIAAGWPVTGYRAPDHPVQKAIRGAVEELAGEETAAVGVDGCGAPVLALSLAGLAGAYLRLVSSTPGSFERTVADAMRAHPVLVSGSLADDFRLMNGIPGLLSKGGAEGVIAVAMPGIGAVALKVDDGAMRARVPVLGAALRRLGLAVPAELTDVPLYGGGEPVGAVHVPSDLFAVPRVG